MQTDENKVTAGGTIAILGLAVIVLGVGLGGGITIGRLISPRDAAPVPEHDDHEATTEVAHAGALEEAIATPPPAPPTFEFARPGDPMPTSMTTSDCLACHQVAIKIVGPSYQQVADKYQRDPDMIRKLARKIVQGGVGVWGQIPMTPHPQHSFEQAQEMVAWVLGQTTAAPAAEPVAESAELPAEEPAPADSEG